MMRGSEQPASAALPALHVTPDQSRVFNHPLAAQPAYESGGRASLLIFHQVTLCLLLFQVTTVALLGAKLCPLPALLVAPTVPATVLFWWVCRRLFERSHRSLSLKDAAKLDAKETTGGNRKFGGVGSAGIPAHQPGVDAADAAAAVAAASAYLSPSFALEERELVAALSELDATSQWVHAGSGRVAEQDLEAQPSLTSLASTLRTAAFASAASEQAAPPTCLSSAWLSAGSFTLRQRGGSSLRGELLDSGVALVVDRSHPPSLVMLTNPVTAEEDKAVGGCSDDSSSSGQEDAANHGACRSGCEA